MKYLYCPKCKELRVKPWYPTKDYCPRCLTPLKVIPIPKTWMTYSIYACVIITFALIYVHTSTNDKVYLYGGVASLAALLVFQFTELTRGHKYSISRLKVTRSDAQAMQTKGWVKK